MSTKKLWWLLPLACLAACSNGANHENANRQSVEKAMADSTAIPLNSSERKIIRTADFKCEVANVMTAVNALERMVTDAGGAVEESKVENTAGNEGEAYYKVDSLKKYHTYTTTATLTLRVPVAVLDSVIRNVPAMVNFIDARTLKESDVTADYTANRLKAETGTKVYSAEKAVKLAKKAEDLVAIQQYEDENVTQLINRKLENMRLLDEVNYATLTIALSQPPQVFVQIIADPAYVASVPFTTQLGEALRSGGNLLGDLFVGLISVWPLLVIGSFFLIYYLRFKRRKGEGVPAVAK